MMGDSFLTAVKALEARTQKFKPRFYSDEQVGPVMAERGYLVLGSVTELKLGSIVQPLTIGDYRGTQPVCVAGATDAHDMAQQHFLLTGEHARAELSHWPFFYRVTSD